MIHITSEAQSFISKLLTRQKSGTQVKITITEPGTPAETCRLSYFTPDPAEESGVEVKFEGFILRADRKDVPLLEQTRIDLVRENLDSYLVVEITQVESPAKGADDEPLVKKISKLIESKVNTRLSSHRGLVRCVGVTKDMFALVEFGGNCRGCPASDNTLREVVRSELLRGFPELSGVLDATETAPAREGQPTEDQERPGHAPTGR